MKKIEYIKELLIDFPRNCGIYSESPRQSIREYRWKIRINHYPDSYESIIRDYLVHDNFEGYMKDIIIRYNNIEELDKLFDNGFKEFKKILETNDIIKSNGILQWLNIELLQYYVTQEFGSISKIERYIERLDKIKRDVGEGKIILNNDSRYIFEMVYQAFKKRKDELTNAHAKILQMMQLRSSIADE